MADFLRIIDRFNITGRGSIYVVEHNKGAVIHIGDTYEDLRGNRFQIKGIEMFRRISNDRNFEDMPIGLMFEPIDKVEAHGNLLIKEQQKINFLFCNHPLYPKQVDEDYEKEFQEAGLEHPCALFSFEDLQMGKLSMFGEKISGITVYRGWMLKPETYRLLYKLLEEKDIILINSPEEYERYHLLPGWYNDFKDLTPESVWEFEGTVESAMQHTKGLTGPYIVKDYVKSRKHEWYSSCYINNIADKEQATKVITNFVSRQGSDLIGGVVLRKFEKLKQIGFHEKSGMPISEEYRVFIFAGQVMIADDYWREDEKLHLSRDEMEWVDKIASKVKSNFVTMDLARKEDGNLIIMEFGDGQVSGLQQIKPELFYFDFEQGKSIPVEELFPEGTVVLAADPMPDRTIEEMRIIIEQIASTQDLVDAYVNVHNKFWFIEDDLYDFEEGTPEYEKVRTTVDAWGELMDELDRKVMQAASNEGLLTEKLPDSGTIKQLETFMNKYGYRDGRGWWVK